MTKHETIVSFKKNRVVYSLKIEAFCFIYIQISSK